MEELISAATELGLAFQVMYDESGQVEAVLIGEPDVVNSMELEEMFKSKVVH